MKMKNILLTSALVLTMALTGCSSEKPSGDKNTDQVEEEKPVEKELTALEKEISELKDYQETDKVYDNKDLEPFNKIMGYYYVANKGRDETKLIDVIPPDKINQAYSEVGVKLELISKLVVPCKFFYIEKDDEWIKTAPFVMGATEWHDFKNVPSEYKYISDEELTEIFGKESSVRRQFKLK